MNTHRISVTFTYHAYPADRPGWDYTVIGPGVGRFGFVAGALQTQGTFNPAADAQALVLAAFRAQCPAYAHVTDIRWMPYRPEGW